MGLRWYPTHMVRARKAIAKYMDLIDIFLEVLDARVPYSSRNPEIDEIIGSKPRVVVLNKADLADPQATDDWVIHLRELGWQVGPTNSRGGFGVSSILTAARELMRPRWEKEEARFKKMGMRFRDRLIRCILVGVPNVGKSSLINRITRHRKAKVGAYAGVTTGEQWLAPAGPDYMAKAKDFQLLDIPGILWSRFEDPEVAFKLSVVGAISADVLDPEPVAVKLLGYLAQHHPEVLAERFGISEVREPLEENLEVIAEFREFWLPGKRLDRFRAADTLLREFRNGTIGRFTLERVEDFGDKFKAVDEVGPAR